MAGVTVQGSTGEAVTLTREERNIVSLALRFAYATSIARAHSLHLPPSLFPPQITSTTRAALDRVHNAGPVIVGTVGAQSTAQAIELCQDAFQSGGEFALVLPPSYYAPAMTPQTLQSFFEDVSSCVVRKSDV